MYNNYWKTHPDIEDKKFGPFVYFESFYQPKLNLLKNPHQSTNIDDMVYETVPEYDRSSTVIYHYNFSNNEIYIIAGHEKPVKLTLRSGLIDPNGSGVRFQDRSMNFQYEFDMGIAVVTAGAIGRISLA